MILVFLVILCGLICYYLSLIKDIKKINKCDHDYDLQEVTTVKNNPEILRMKQYKRCAGIAILIVSSFIVYYYITVVSVATSLFGSATDCYNRKDYVTSKVMLKQYMADYPNGKHISEVNDMLNEIDKQAALQDETKKEQHKNIDE